MAFHFVPENPDEPGRSITYSELRDDVCRAANALRGLGIGKGDVVGIYMGMVPELPVAMLACARIGAPHVVVFGGFSAASLGERLESTGAKLVITQDEAWRKGAAIPLKQIADEAAGLAPTVERMLVLRRSGADVPMQDGRDVWWHELVAGQPAECEPEPVEAEHTLFCLHTSGTTAKPKAAVHTTGGYLTYAAAHPPAGCSTCRRATSGGAPPTSAGSPATATSSTGRSTTAPPACSTRATRCIPAPTATGRSSSATGSPSTTRRPR